jgi:hypothetical protein
MPPKCESISKGIHPVRCALGTRGPCWYHAPERTKTAHDQGSSISADAPFPIRLRRGRRMLFTAIYLGLLAIVTLAGLELISRRLFQPQTLAVYYSGEIAFDPEIGWRGQRNLSALVTHGRYPLPIQLDINADGFRDASWDEKLRRATEQRRKKILILGDSLVYGWANPVDGRISEELQARYEVDGGPRAEVFNTGIPGYGPNHQLRLLPELLQRLHPDEVVLIFCLNDYADAAFPYDYRYPFRVYQPFYDRQGRLLFNSRVPRRPSLAMRDSFLGGLRLWYAVDQLRYAVEDQRYSRYGIPNARTAPVHLFADISINPELRARFPYVEATVFSLYQRMSELCRSAGTRFTFLPSIPFDRGLRANLESRGVRYLPCPEDANTYSRWLPTLQDGHPNLIWAWILANALYAELQGQPYRLDFRQMPQWRDIPAELDLSSEQACARFLCLEWGPAENGGRRIRGPASFFLRNATPGRMRLEITGSAPQPTRFVVQQDGGRELCRITIGPAASTQACILDTVAGEPLLFAHLVPETSLAGGELPLLQRVRLAQQ